MDINDLDIDQKKSRSRILVTIIMSIALIIVVGVGVYFTFIILNRPDEDGPRIEVATIGGEYNDAVLNKQNVRIVYDLAFVHEVDLTDLKVENNSETDMYVLVNVDINVASNLNSSDTARANLWYNIAGDKVNTDYVDINLAEPSVIEAGESKNLNIIFEVPDSLLIESLVDSTSVITVTTFGMKKEDVVYSNRHDTSDLYISYYICKAVGEMSGTITNEPQGEPLLQIGNVKDVYDEVTSTITRNIKTIEFTGDEEWWILYKSESLDEGISFQYGGKTGGLNDKVIRFNSSVCSHFRNVPGAWRHMHKGKLGIYTDHEEYYRLYFRAPDGRPDIDTLDEWREYLREQYESGNPVTVWYQTIAPETEYVN